MRTPFVLLLLGCPTLAVDEPVPLVAGTSPDGKHEILLHADKDSPSWDSYTFRGDVLVDGPHFLVRNEQKEVIHKFNYGSDPNSDSQPLRMHTEVLWSPTGKAVVVNTRERFYSNCRLFAIEGGMVKEIAIPDYRTLTGYPPPDSQFLRSRGFSRFDGWTDDGNLIYTLRLSPVPLYEGEDPLHHRVVLKVSPEGCSVISRSVPD